MSFDPGGPDPDMPPTTEDETKSSQCPMFHPSDLVGHTSSLLDPQEDGQRFCAHIVQAIEDQYTTQLHGNAEWFRFCCLCSIPQTLLATPSFLIPNMMVKGFVPILSKPLKTTSNAQLHDNVEWFKFCCSINNDHYEEICSYNEILNTLSSWMMIEPNCGSSDTL